MHTFFDKPVFLFLLGFLTSALPHFIRGQRNLAITADQSFRLYINGIEASLSNSGDFQQVDLVELLPDNRLLAVEATGSGDWCSGILASVDNDEAMTDYRWRCTNELLPNWMDLGLEDYDWQFVNVIGSNGDVDLCPQWTTFEDISPSASWIWTMNLTESSRDTIIYCRAYLPICDSSPCQNGASCNPNGVDSICECLPGYTGQYCETHIVQECGDYLHTAPADIIVPPGWTSYCYIGRNDSSFVNYRCTELLTGLPDYDNATYLLESGGNFGCWGSNGYPDSDLLNACTDNYQQNFILGNCVGCQLLGVCIRYPA